MKLCYICKIEQFETEFHKNKNRKDGLSSHCKNCQKQYKLDHRDEISEFNKQYYLYHKDEILESRKQYRLDHKFEITEYRKNYEKEKYDSDPLFKLFTNLRNRILMAIKKNGKSARTKELLGCSVKYLKFHLESLFLEDMSWENHGVFGWHVDHIKPCSSFDLSKPEEQRKCFHYTNLQPLWAIDNLKKSNKILEK